LNHLPFDEYKSKVESCDFAVFGHLRQQALGNIFLAIMNRQTVYLPENSVNSMELARRGLIHQTFRLGVAPLRLQPIDEEQRMKNVQRLIESDRDFRSADKLRNWILNEIEAKRNTSS